MRGHQAVGNPIENLQNQLPEDKERFGDLMIEIKLAILEGLKKLAEQQPEELLFDTEE